MKKEMSKSEQMDAAWTQREATVEKQKESDWVKAARVMKRK